MASPAQLTANRLNAQSSTGPTTPEGKLKSSTNATQLGLFSKRDHVPEEFRDAYTALRDSMLAQLQPASALEQVFAREIISATWRLERCAQIEADLDSVQNEPNSVLDSVARARTAASRVLWRSISELRRLQTERFTRKEMKDEKNEGLASTVEIQKNVAAPESVRKALMERQETKFLQEMITAFPPAPSFIPQRIPAPAIQTQIARNALCPCGSGKKHKRCCGTEAAPLIQRAHAG